MGISKELLKNFDSNFISDEKNIVAMNAVMNNGINNSAKNSKTVRSTTYEFSIQIPQKGMTHQDSSGRCWLFAATNCLRYQMIKKYNLEDYELSQTYLMFYDKLEKANFFLESMIELIDEPVSGRLVSYLLSAPLNDGGQWDMFCNVVRKYGIVPKTAMPESSCSSNSQEMNRYITEKLRQSTAVLRKAHAEGKTIEELTEMKNTIMSDVYKMLCICLGEPPKTFDFEVRTKDDKYIADYGITPLEFYKKYIPIDLDDYVSLINAPTDDKPYGKSFTVKYLGNVKEGHIVRYLNLKSDELKKAALKQLKDGEPVWFGCDVGKRESRNEGIMDLNMFNLKELFGTDLEMTKAEKLDYGQSQMTHAMVFQGVNLGKNGKPNRWRVENSWGEEPGKKGYFVMSDEWFSEYMYQVVVNKKYLTKKQLTQYEATPIELEPWDPMGSLAD